MRNANRNDARRRQYSGGGAPHPIIDRSPVIYLTAKVGIPVGDGGSMASQTWLDQSGNGHHATGVGTVTYRADAKGSGYPGVDFAGGDFAIDHAPILTALAALEYTMYAVVNVDVLADQTLLGGGNVGAGPWMRQRLLSAGTMATQASVGTFAISAEGLSVDTMTLISVAADDTGGDVSVWWDGTADTNNPDSWSPINPTISRATIGALRYGAGNYEPLNGIIHAIVLFDSVHGTADRTAIEAYLKSEWGIS